MFVVCGQVCRTCHNAAASYHCFPPLALQDKPAQPLVAWVVDECVLRWILPLLLIWFWYFRKGTYKIFWILTAEFPYLIIHVPLPFSREAGGGDALWQLKMIWCPVFIWKDAELWLLGITECLQLNNSGPGRGKREVLVAFHLGTFRKCSPRNCDHS